MDAVDALLRALHDEVADPEEGDSPARRDARPQQLLR